MQEARLVSDDIPYGAVVSSFVKLGGSVKQDIIGFFRFNEQELVCLEIESYIAPRSSPLSEFAALKENKQTAFPSSAAVPDAYFFRLSMAKLHFFKTRKGKGCK
ncbi:hypothetical protein OIU78_004607 [Salix suchowensis]|nr:hypothetical protein OIU78_004607 [Salix suchowensis]